MPSGYNSIIFRWIGRLLIELFYLEMIPEDSRVEIDAKINAGYFTTGKHYTMEELAHIKGRGWEKWEDVTVGNSQSAWSLIELLANN
jgi:hypothetical protein